MRARVLGVGGVFFRSANPARLGDWYRRWLGFPIEQSPISARFQPAEQPPGAYTVWAPFPAETDYFGSASQPYMVNLIVDELEGVLRQVSEGGARVVGNVEDYPYGRFGWFEDPDGNRVELWQPRLTEEA